MGEALGWFGHWGIVDKISLCGRACVTPAPEVGVGHIQPYIVGPGPTDPEHVYVYCSLLSDDEHWESVRDGLRVQVDAIVETHWLAIAVMAGELDRKGVILRPEILKICGAFPPTA